jgi:hypothetical protein
MTQPPARRLAAELKSLALLYVAIAVLPLLLGWCSS